MTAFDRVARYVVETYSVEYNLFSHEGEDEDIFFRCPECDEYLLKEDWDEDEEMAEGICPVCGFSFYEEEE